MKKLYNFYHPQRTCVKVMFSKASVSHSVHKLVCLPHLLTPPTSPRADPLGIHPLDRQPIGRHPLWQTHPWSDTSPGQIIPHIARQSPWADTPWPDKPPGQTPPSPPSACWDTHPLPSAHWDTHPLPLLLSAFWDTTSPPRGHCSGRYASYWNVFLLPDGSTSTPILLSRNSRTVTWVSPNLWRKSAVFKGIFYPVHVLVANRFWI